MEEMTELQEIKGMLAELLLRVPAKPVKARLEQSVENQKRVMMRTFESAVKLPNRMRHKRSYPVELAKFKFNDADPDKATPAVPLAILFNRCSSLKVFAGGTSSDVRKRLEETLAVCTDLVVFTLHDALFRKNGTQLVVMTKKVARERLLEMDKAVVITTDPAREPVREPEPEPEPIPATEPEPEIEPAITLRKGLTPLVIRERTAYGG